MSLAKLKKAELQELFTANNLSFDPDWNKDELVGELEEAGIFETEKTDAKHSDGKHLTKADRQKRLLARTDQSPGEAELFRSKAERQKTLLARTDRTK